MDNKLMIKISKLYYLQQMTKVEIARKLRISRFKVARFLDKAREKGIVKIDIIDHERNTSELEERLEQKLGLDEVIVMNASKKASDAELINILGQGASKLFVETVQDNDVIGISWGATLSEVVRVMEIQNSYKNLTVVQITGGMGQLNSIDGIKVVYDMATKLNARSSMLLTPILVQTPKAKEVLLQDNGIKGTYDLFEKINVALIGIGGWYPNLTSNLPKAGCFQDEDIKMLQKNGVVADIFSHFVDIKGNVVDGPLKDRIMSIDIETARKISFVIGVAGGPEKTMAIIGAARSGLINALVTDSCTAENILNCIDLNNLS
jgi:DNA-binding transcriptional regulator LsrR (DeoR family)